MGSRAVICAVFTVGAVVVSACGGIDEPDLFSSGGGATSGGDAGNVNQDGSARDSGNGGGGDSGGGGHDAGGGGKDSGGGGKDSGSGSDLGIYCGNGTALSNAECTGGQICCVRNNELGGATATFACGSEGDCTGDSFGDLVIPCDDAFDCAGDICCGTFVTGSPSYYSDVSCQSSCDGANARVFCDPTKGNADCVNGGSCLSSGSMPGYHVCG